MSASPLLVGDEGAPLWPNGVVGSISHTGHLEGGLAVAVVARRDAVCALGVDAERARALPLAVWNRVLTRAERSHIGSLIDEKQGWLARLTFSAKEAVFKCQYPLSRAWLGFQDVETEFDLSRGTFSGRGAQPRCECAVRAGALHRVVSSGARMARLFHFHRASSVSGVGRESSTRADPSCALPALLAKKPRHVRRE